MALGLQISKELTGEIFTVKLVGELNVKTSPTLESEIKNMQIICPFCFKYEIMDNCKNEYLSSYIDILKRIYNENPKCSINLSNNCLYTGSIWCTGCLNWICKN